jgi:hypothetical protein
MTEPRDAVDFRSAVFARILYATRTNARSREFIEDTLYLFPFTQMSTIPS